MVKHKGKLIIFEGVDGVGKTTIINQVYSLLIRNGYKKVIRFKNIEDSSVSGSAIRKILDKNKNEFVNSTRIALLYSSELMYVYYKKNGILDYLNKGYLVLLDRSIYSTYAYAGDCDTVLNVLDALKVKLPKEDLLVYIDASIGSIMARLNKGKKDLYESEDKVRKHLTAYNKLFLNKVEFIGEKAVSIDKSFVYIRNNDVVQPTKRLPGSHRVFNKIEFEIKGVNNESKYGSGNDFSGTIFTKLRILWRRLFKN